MISFKLCHKEGDGFVLNSPWPPSTEDTYFAFQSWPGDHSGNCWMSCWYHATDNSKPGNAWNMHKIYTHCVSIIFKEIHNARVQRKKHVRLRWRSYIPILNMLFNKVTKWNTRPLWFDHLVRFPNCSWTSTCGLSHQWCQNLSRHLAAEVST